MSKFAMRTAVVGAGIALAAVLSPVAHAADHSSADVHAASEEVTTFEPAALYRYADTGSKKVKDLGRGVTLDAKCFFHRETGGGSNWYAIDNGGAGTLWAESKHFNSVQLPKCAGSQ